jgi:hypothetical protein
MAELVARIHKKDTQRCLLQLSEDVSALVAYYARLKRPKLL